MRAYCLTITIMLKTLRSGGHLSGHGTLRARDPSSDTGTNSRILVVYQVWLLIIQLLIFWTLCTYYRYLLKST